ncbi:MAG: mannose-1-phosphate guanylyltransferase [Deltaproteobacteria bacterium]|nr:MAG: mannose-1-phosphate guanylyltransferase [Deltaproteobacteria bacterium]
MDHAVVMAGGSGTRFWPESRALRSKQFLNLTGGGPMIRETLSRLSPVVPPERLWVVAGRKDAPHLSPAALGIPKGNILLEPEGKNTGPAIALAAARISRKDPDAVILATPADHAIADVPAFRAVIRKGLRLARETGRIVTLGVPPTHPATGYGYIERGRPFPGSIRGAFRVARFTEKPDLATAKRFLRSGRFDWNSGVFLFRADTFADRLARFLPEVDRGIRKAFRGDARGFDRRIRDAYRRMPSVSVDYGILEKEQGILVLPANVGWSDLGTWRSLHEFLDGTGGNVTFGDVILAECRNTLVRTDGGVVAVLGMEDVVVVRSGNAVLVCPRSRSEEVKRMAEEVRRRYPALA